MPIVFTNNPGDLRDGADAPHTLSVAPRVPSWRPQTSGPSVEAEPPLKGPAMSASRGRIFTTVTLRFCNALTTIRLVAWRSASLHKSGTSRP